MDIEYTDGKINKINLFGVKVVDVNFHAKGTQMTTGDIEMVDRYVIKLGSDGVLIYLYVDGTDVSRLSKFFNALKAGLILSSVDGENE